MISLICLTNISRHNTVELSKEISDSEKSFLHIYLCSIWYIERRVGRNDRHAQSLWDSGS